MVHLDKVALDYGYPWALMKLKEIDAILPDAIVVSEVPTSEESKSIKNFRIVFSKQLGKSMINFYKYSPSFE